MHIMYNKQTKVEEKHMRLNQNKLYYMNKLFVLGMLLLGLPLASQAQTVSVNYVTEIVTSFGGYWRSGSGTTNGTTNVNPTRPDNSHNLLSFTANSLRYSTGVDDELLQNKGLTFKAAKFQALPVGAIGVPTTNTKVGVGQFYDGVNNGASDPPPNNPLASYLTDGPNGLDIGTGVANLPKGELSFAVRGVQENSLNDGIPDILVTQIASPNNSLPDTYGFYDAQDQLVGNTVDVVYDNNFPVVGYWMADFYEASQTPRILTATFRNTERPIRLWSAELTRFGVNSTNYGKITKFKISLSGDSDVAFVAYNSQSVTVLPVVLTSFKGKTLTNNEVQLTWRTASEVNSEAFVIESSATGNSFAPVGRVAAAGSKTSPTDYAYRHQPTTTGIVYYRLRQLDRDGSSAYSPVVAVTVDNEVSAAVQVVPNPFRETMQLQLPPATAGEVRLLSLAGKTLCWHRFTADELAKGACLLPQVSDLQPGMYMLQIMLDGRIANHKVVKQ